MSKPSTLRGALVSLIVVFWPAPAAADGTIRPLGEVRRFAAEFTRGEIVPLGDAVRSCDPIWDGSLSTGYVSTVAADRLILDWGDIGSTARIDRFEIGYATNWPAAEGLDIDVVFFVEENGWNSENRAPVAAFRLRGLPGHIEKAPGNTGWVIAITLEEGQAFRLLGPDLETGPDDPPPAPGCDGFGLPDFGFSYHFVNIPDSFYAGPIMTWVDPNLPTCPAPGVEAAADLFVTDPKNPPEPNSVLFAGQNIPYDRTLWFGSWPPVQYHMKLSTCEAAPPCPALEAPCWNADIAPGAGIRAGGGDCVVDLGDLSVLLANFGTTSGATFADGDIDPPLNLDTLAVGDGDVDLADLSRLLAAYGADCR